MSPINEENLQKWVQKGNILATITSSKHQLQIYQWFMHILLDKGRTFPMRDVSLVSGTSKTDIFKDFTMRLLFFWSGSNTLSFTNQYTISFTEGGFPKTDQIHRTLYLPQDVRSKKELYSKLIVSTFNIAEGKGYYGGHLLA